MRDRLVRHSLLVIAVLASTATASAMNFSPAPGADAAVGDTLRAAILAANATPEDDLITLVAGTYDISLPNGGVQENLGNTGDLDVLQGTVRIVGAGAGVTIVAVVGQQDRAFHVAGATLILRDLSVKDGVARDDGTAVAPDTTPAAGGGILCSLCTLELEGVTLASNVAAGGNGAAGVGGVGGFFGQDAAGGGVFAVGATVRLAATTRFEGNQANAGAGGNGAAQLAAAGGAGGHGGSARGGGLYVGGTFEVGGPAVFSANLAAGGNGGHGGAGEPGGFAGSGGDARGGALFAPNATLPAGSLFGGDVARGGAGGDGGVGDGSVGGAGGAGGFAGGGGAWVEGLAPSTMTGVSFSGEQAMGGTGGSGGFASTSGGQGGQGGDARGGALHAPTASLPAGGLFGGDVARGGDGGDGGQGSEASGGSGGAGGAAGGGGVWLEGGAPSTMTGVTFSGEQATGGDGGTASNGSTAGGHGGAGGDSFGGALAVAGDLTLDRVELGDQVSQGGVGGDAGAAGSGPGGAGGDGGSCTGGAVAVSSGIVELRVSRAHGNACLAGVAGFGGAGTTGGPGGVGGAALGGAVGALAPGSSLLVIDSEVAGNDATAGAGGHGGAGGAIGGAGGAGTPARGGGIYTASGQLDVRNTTLSGNRALGAAGGDGGAGLSHGAFGGDAQGGNLFTLAAGIVLSNSTLNLGVTSAGPGGTESGGGSPGLPGDESGGNLGIGEGVANGGTLTSTLLANGTAGADPDLGGFVNACRSLVETLGPGGGQVLACDVTYGNTVDPQLLPLAFNGGTTRTHAFPATSFVRDRGTNPIGLPFDQRGTPYARVAGGEADIGAFELAGNQLAAVSVTVAPMSVPEDGPGALVFTFLRTDSQDAPLALALAICYDIGGTASQAADYTGFSTGGACLLDGTVTFAPGALTATVTLTPTPDAVPEVPESVVFSVLAGVGHAPTAPNPATGTIVDTTAVAAIPTVGEWGLLGLALLLGALAVRRLLAA